MASNNGPVYLSCIECGKIAAVVNPPKLSGLSRVAIETAVGGMTDGERDGLGSLADRGTLFGIPAESASQLLNLRCGVCFLATIAPTGELST